MFKNYLKVALRNIIKYKGYSFINIAGLAFGMACFILILLLVQDELGYDRFHEKGEQIYRVISVQERNGETEQVALTSAPLAQSLKQNFPEIIDAACFNYGVGGLVTYEDKSFREGYFSYTDSAFFKMFSFTFVRGNPESALDDPYSAVLSEPVARKYFADRDPIGKTLRVKDGASLTVTGVIRAPKNSHIEVNFVVSNQLLKEQGVDITSWNRLNYTTYVLLRKDVEVENLRQKIAGHIKKAVNPQSDTTLNIQPLKRIYLHSDFAYDIMAKTSDINLVYILLLIAVLILVLACINFMNLATARSEKRRREIGLRKVVGADRRQLFRQFIGESIILSLIALFFAVILVEIALPYLNRITLKELTFYRSANLSLVLGLIGIAIATGIMAGSYPAVFLSSFRPVTALKSIIKGRAKGSVPRKVLAIGQFSVSIMLIIGTVVIHKQLHFMQNMKLGYDKEQLVCISMNRQIKGKHDALKNELLQNPGILNVTASMNLPTWEGPSVSLSDWEGRDSDKQITMYHGSVDYDYFKTFKMEIIQGRGFSREFPTDLTAALIVNEEAVKQMGMENPIGKRLSMWGHSGRIIGVVKNFNFDNLRSRINPLVLKLAPGETYYLIIRLNPNNIATTLDFIEDKWKNAAPGYPFRFIFLDEALNRMYRMEMKVGQVISIFAALAIFISCMGLFGLASFTAQQRTKEIGIRKVLGASVSGVVQLLSKEFFKWVLIANLLAWPAAYVFMNSWLQHYAYRINMSIWIFLLSGALALVIAILTVSYQSIRAAIANPVETLRYE